MTVKVGYQVSVSENEGIVEIVIEGEVTGATINNLHLDVMKVIKGRKAIGLLCDIRKLKGYNEDYASAYFRVRTLPSDVKLLPAAIIIEPLDDAFASFYETTSSNAGHTTKMFSDIAAAKDWLKRQIIK